MGLHQMVEAEKPTCTLITITVELFGLARIACGSRIVRVSVPEHAETAEVVTALSDAYPELVGTAIREDRADLLASYTFNLNGTRFVSGQRLGLKPGDSLLLFSSQAGG